MAAATRRVALATAAHLHRPDDDEPALLAALRALGVDAAPAVWDDPQVRWDELDLVVVRSTWDYVPRRDAFVAWAERVERTTPIFNPSAVLRWNTDKRYLDELDAPVVPTTFVAPGAEVQLPRGDYVIKPSISAGARDTARYRPGEDVAARAHLGSLARAGRTAMVQPFVTSVDTRGEHALLYFDGAFSHAIRKGPILLRDGGRPADLYAPDQLVAVTPSPAELDLGEQVLARVAARFGMPLYARVDLVTSDRGAPVVLELELTEPSLFLAHGRGAAESLAAAIVKRL